jgi:peroxiredoxin
MKGRRLGLALALLALVPAASRAAEGPKPLAIGSAAPDFDLPGVDGKRYTLRDFAGAKALVMVFTADHCPTAQAYEERIEALHAAFKDRGARFVLVSPNDPHALRLDEQGFTDLGDTLEDMKVRARDRRWTFPFLYDGETQAMSRLYGPQATPHVFVFDAAQRLRYSGRVDDAENPANTKTADARDAIEAVLSGRTPAVATTKTFGCSIKWADKSGWVQKGLDEWAKEPVALTAVDLDGIRAIARNDGDKLRLVNAWATWCGPCTIEFPQLVDLNRIYRGRAFEVVTISADAPDKHDSALQFLTGKQASMRNVRYEKGEPYDLVDAVDAEWGGALPFTMLVAPGGRVLYRTQGPFDVLELRKAIVGWLGRYYHSRPGGQ